MYIVYSDARQGQRIKCLGKSPILTQNLCNSIMIFMYLQAHATDVASLNSELSSLHSARDCLWEEVQRLAGVVEGLEGELLESKRSLEQQGWELTGAQRAVREAGVKLTQQVGGSLIQVVFIGGEGGEGVRGGCFKTGAYPD